MLVTLFGSLILQLVASGFDMVLGQLFETLNLDMGIFTNTFPIIIDFYEILQAVAVGLVLGIGLFQLLRFFTGRTSEMRETPIQTIVNMAIAVVFIYFGNYILMWIVDLFNLPYHMMIDKLDSYSLQTFIEGVQLPHEDFLDALLTLFDPTAASIDITIWLICLILIVYHTCKILLEVVERYVVLCVLVYTSPLAWATLSSNATRPIFKKWLTMFISACLMILLSAWSLVIMFHALAYVSQSVLIATLLFVALSKISQKMDNILQTLGLNPVITGAGLLEDVVAGVGTLMTAKKTFDSSSVGRAIGDRRKSEWGNRLDRRFGKTMGDSGDTNDGQTSNVASTGISDGNSASTNVSTNGDELNKNTESHKQYHGPGPFDEVSESTVPAAASSGAQSAPDANLGGNVSAGASEAIASDSSPVQNFAADRGGMPPAGGTVEVPQSGDPQSRAATGGTSSVPTDVARNTEETNAPPIQSGNQFTARPVPSDNAYQVTNTNPSIPDEIRGGNKAPLENKGDSRPN